MKTLIFNDWNAPRKFWYIKRSKAGHYFYNQRINGQHMSRSSYKRKSGKFLARILKLSYAEFRARFENQAPALRLAA